MLAVEWRHAIAGEAFDGHKSYLMCKERHVLTDVAPTGEKRGRLHSLPKFVRSRGCIFIEATKHDDLQEPDRFTGLSMLSP
ncbi:hypothetical protein VTO58DRAFT_103350 [Aureobasidium pullulans]